MVSATVFGGVHTARVGVRLRAGAPPAGGAVRPPVQPTDTAYKLRLPRMRPAGNATGQSDPDLSNGTPAGRACRFGDLSAVLRSVPPRASLDGVPFFDALGKCYRHTGDLRYALEIDRFLFYEGVVRQRGLVDLPLEMCCLERGDVPRVGTLPDILFDVRALIVWDESPSPTMTWFLARVLPCRRTCRARRPATTDARGARVCLWVVMAFVLGLYPHSFLVVWRLMPFALRASVYARVWALLAADVGTQARFLAEHDSLVQLALVECVFYLMCEYGPCELAFFLGPDVPRAKRAIMAQCRNVCNGVRSSWDPAADGVGFSRLEVLCRPALDKCRRVCKNLSARSGAERASPALPTRRKPPGGATSRVLAALGMSRCTSSMNVPSVYRSRGASARDEVRGPMHQAVVIALRDYGVGTIRVATARIDPAVARTLPCVIHEELAHVLHAYGRGSVDIVGLVAFYYVQNTVYWVPLDAAAAARQLRRYRGMRARSVYQAEADRFCTLCVACSAAGGALFSETRLDLGDTTRRVCMRCARSDTVASVDMIGKLLAVGRHRYRAHFRAAGGVSVAGAAALVEEGQCMRFQCTGRAALDILHNDALLREQLGATTLHACCELLDSASNAGPEPASPVADALSRADVVDADDLRTCTLRMATRVSVFDSNPLTSRVYIAPPRGSRDDEDPDHSAPRCTVCRSPAVARRVRCVDAIFMCTRDLFLCARDGEAHSIEFPADFVDWHVTVHRLYMRRRAPT